MKKSDELALAFRIYCDRRLGGGYEPRDFEDAALLKPGFVFVEPLKPPEMYGSIHIGIETDAIEGKAHLLYKVVGVGPNQAADSLTVEVGDVIAVRTAHLDPLTAEQRVLGIDGKHIWKKWPKDHVEPEFNARVAEAG